MSGWKQVVVDLQEGTPVGDFVEWRGFCDPNAHSVVWTQEGARHVMVQNVEPGNLSPAEARALAAALLAAAEVSELVR